MKKHVFLLFLLFAMPALVLPVTEEGISIAGLSMDPVPFNERRDPAADSPFNAFDGDLKTAALYSDFTMEFSQPVTIDQIKIMNGNASGKEKFKKDNRERDIEIILYTVAVKENKSEVKSIKKKKTVKPGTAESKKTPVKDKDIKDKIEPDKTEKDKIEKEKKDNDIKKSATPEKIVMRDEYDTSAEYRPEGVKLYFTASETVIEPEKKTADEIKTEKTEEKKPAALKTDNKNPEKKKETAAKPVKPKNAEKKTAGKTQTKKETEKKSAVKQAKPPVVKKEKTPDKNIIEITNSKKDGTKIATPASEDKKSAELKKDNMTEYQKKEMDETERKKALAAEDKSVKAKTDNPPKKKPAPENKKTVSKKPEKKQEKKPAAKTPVSKIVKKNAAKKEQVKKETAEKDTGKTKIEIVDSKSKPGKTAVTADKKNQESKKAVKPETVKKDSEKITVKPGTEKKKEQKSEIKTENKKEIKKEEKKQAADIKPVEDVKVKKMTGIVRIENDAAGRVLVYASLKDSMDFQSIDLKGKYTVKKIDFRTRDDEYYAGDVPDRSGIGEISFFNSGKKITVQGIDSMKKSYIERYSKNLADSLSDETFIMYENGDIVLRMKFRKDGRMEFFDRYKCSKKGDADCTYLSMPDMWRVADGKLMMRYHTLWRVWKYELDSQNDMLTDSGEAEPPRWMKLYYKSDTGFTDKYLELYRSEKGIWAE